MEEGGGNSETHTACTLSSAPYGDCEIKSTGLDLHCKISDPEGKVGDL